MIANSNYAADAIELLNGLGVHQASPNIWELTDVHTASESHVHHSQMPAALAAYAAVNATFAAGRFGVWGAMEPKTNVSLTTSAQSPLPRHPPR
ncbi:hypothetical protein C7A10_31175 [Pseudomonas fluorescens]|uniref:Uncharacterized protein n=1 Tax=Pseudomonas fluorescens TaxID=294 RepID=A0A2T0HJD7_PSEFL|nr:hypothetical protein C7A10_31175 [Pseudomonas fluorescens]